MAACDVVIVGAGPAGMTAALQLRRYGIPALLFEAGQPGGLLLNANLVENYPGFPGGIPGAVLAERFCRQACSTGVEFLYEEILAVTHGSRGFDLLSDRATYQARILVLAAGTRPHTFPRDLTEGLDPQRILYEVYPLRGISGSRIAVVGAGDAAFDYALSLAGRDNQVAVLNRGSALKCLPLLRERAADCAKITYRAETRIEKITLLSTGELRLDCISPGGRLSLQVDYVLGALGRTPRLELLANLPEPARLQEEGSLHLVGDIHNGMHRQTAIAAGDGLSAAMKIYQHIQEA